MTDSPPDEHTYTVRCREGLTWAVRGTTLWLDDGTAIVRKGDRIVGLYSLTTHSVTREDAS